MVWRDKASSVWGNFTGLSKQCLTSQQPPGQLLWLIAGESKTNRQKAVMNLSSVPTSCGCQWSWVSPSIQEVGSFSAISSSKQSSRIQNQAPWPSSKGQRALCSHLITCCSLCRRHAYSACKLNYFLIIQLRIIWYDSLWKVFPTPFLKLTYKNVQNPTLTSNK